MEFVKQLWLVTLEAAPWLLLGLIVAGLMKSFMPTGLLSRWLGGRGIGPVLRAAIIGTPFPLCSCSVVPAALALRRGGASKASTVSFLVSTPENGADSVTLSYAMLGPFMMVARLVSALFSAVWAGMATVWWTRADMPQTVPSDDLTSSHVPNADPDENETVSKQNKDKSGSVIWRTISGLRYAVLDLYQDIALWMGIGLMLAAVINTFIPPESLAQWGSGLPVMLLMLLVGVPMYICATASTPVAASMLIAGVSPGTVLVFLLAGPATNLGTLGIVRKELGNRAAGAYLLGAGGGALVCGYLTDLLLSRWSFGVVAQVSHAHHIVPDWLAVTSVVILGVCTLWMIGRRARHLAGGKAESCCNNSGATSTCSSRPLTVKTDKAASCCDEMTSNTPASEQPAKPCRQTP